MNSWKKRSLYHVPQIVDYAVGNSLALEADGFTHFYAGTENFTAKAKLKHRILRFLSTQQSYCLHNVLTFLSGPSAGTSSVFLISK